MNWKTIRVVTLSGLILLSLFLSWRIWTAGESDGVNQTPVRTATPTVTFERSKAHVFGPVQIIVHENQGKRGSTNLKMLSYIEEEFQGWQVTYMEEPVQISNDAYQDVMSRRPGVELIFEGRIPFGLYEDVFTQLPGEYSERTFNRAFIPLDNPMKIYFYDSITHLFYDMNTEGITEEDVAVFAYNEEADYSSVEAVKVKDKHIYLPTGTIDVPYRDYLIERLPNSLFVNSFFQETSEVDVRRDENVTRYLDYISELRINEDHHLLTYRKQPSTEQPTSLVNRLNSGFDQLFQYEKWTEEIHYHEFNPETRTITFRRYLGGLPVFGYFDYGDVQIRTRENELTYLRMPLEVVQTPIASVNEDQTITLESGPQVIAQIVANGLNLEDIENIRIGLNWERSEESSQVVRFNPNWYVLENGQWLEIDRYITRQGGEMQDGL